jgi:hypothetical protein
MRKAGWSTESGMQRRIAMVAASLVSGMVAGAMLSPALAGEMKPDEAKRFIANKLFSYNCFDGSTGAGRIQADGSVIGTMEASGRTRYFSLPAGTIKLTADSICASLPRAIIQPCFNVVQTSPHSFRGSLRGLSFAYCDFERRNARVDLARHETSPQPVQSAVALRPSRYGD